MNKLLISLLVSLGIAGFAHAEGDAEAGQAKAAVCFGCHGADGNATTPTFPKLAAQHENYLVKQLKEFKSGDRPSATMAGFAAGLSEDDMADLAAFFGSLEVKLGDTSDARGQEIYEAGLADKGVAACGACHGTQGEGNALAGFPTLKGQYATYVEAQLKAFRDGARANDPNGMMRGVAANMSDADMKAVATYVEGMGK
ncbi:cytochrome c [Motiliproteus sp. SC1-56]|uniref:c-type cytochrome n=1 Tax=Motiliproteus sp. SC1-56 TaxID=2799565 RepID=UPI001A8DFAEF|nr:c-type cytochrome [Motiliproteus sp. SC1-56]